MTLFKNYNKIKCFRSVRFHFFLIKPLIKPPTFLKSKNFVQEKANLKSPRFFVWKEHLKNSGQEVFETKSRYVPETCLWKIFVENSPLKVKRSLIYIFPKMVLPLP